MNELYETKISDKRWLVYDIPGDIGWIMYLIGVILCFVKSPEFTENRALLVIMVLAVIPALMMLLGVGELISERVQKLDRILPKKRLLRGFGALTCGGVVGTIISIVGLIYFSIAVNQSLTYLIVMAIGAILCTVFAGLIYKTFYKR